jgi:hypothetical protein
VERGHLIRAFICAAAAAAVVASAAAGGVTIRWSPVAAGSTLPNGKQAPTGYLALSRTQESAWIGRLTPADRTAVRRVGLATNGVVAAFLDGLPCASQVAVTRVARTTSTLTVGVAYTRPPIGVGTCVRTSTPYLVIRVRRTALGRPAPRHVDVVARARA